MRVSSLLALGVYAVAGRASDLSDDNPNNFDADGNLHADVVERREAAASLEASLPRFTPTTLKAPFLEQFTDDWESRWKPSHAKKANTEEDWQFTGEWKVEEPFQWKGIVGDKGLVLKNKAAHHAISAKFNKPIDNKGKTLVIQYEVKLQKFLECGGAYMKLLQQNAALGTDEFSNASPYIIMFGPDKCGATNKVHFIFRHKNPSSGEYEEKHMDDAPSAIMDKLTNLYTLIIRPDQTFELLINNESEKTGSLLEDFTPTVNPPTEIDDPDDKKPEDWVEEAKIKDPDAKKPDDWDEDAPYEIVDAEATKPEGWLDNEPKDIPDPEATKPEDWDDEEDGTWEAPLIDNPKCEAVGCGPWDPPMIRNPAYKGKWSAPLIDNPAYKGVWAPRKIKNPHFFEDKTPSNLEPMGAIGFELWTMNEDILFDNIYIGHSVEEAEQLRKETYDVKVAEERKQRDAEVKATDGGTLKKATQDLVFMDDPALYVTEKVKLFIELVQKNPVDAVKFVPEVAGAIGLGLITILIVVFGGAAAAPSADQVKAKAKDAKDAAQKTKDQVADAVASGAEKAKEEATKRTTRSSAQ